MSKISKSSYYTAIIIALALSIRGERRKICTFFIFAILSNSYSRSRLFLAPFAIIAQTLERYYDDNNNNSDNNNRGDDNNDNNGMFSAASAAFVSVYTERIDDYIIMYEERNIIYSSAQYVVIVEIFPR